MSTAEKFRRQKIFCVTDVTSERQDLASRKELKFSVRAPDIAKLRTAITRSCTAVQHGEGVSRVNSVYFDTPRLSACYANLNGYARRNKLRIRWYDLPKPEHDFFVEEKWRLNRVTGKRRYRVHSEISLVELSYRQIQHQLELTMPESSQPLVTKNFEPIVLVSYSREHFVSPDSKLRLTVDYDLKFVDQTGKMRISSKFPFSLLNTVVVEAKVPVGREQEVRDLLSPFQFRVQRFSKYVHGCKMISQIHPSAL